MPSSLCNASLVLSLIWTDETGSKGSVYGSESWYSLPMDLDEVVAVVECQLE
jgi:hypothetical protein